MITANKNELRKTGVDVVGDIPWGTHFCSARWKKYSRESEDAPKNWANERANVRIVSLTYLGALCSQAILDWRQIAYSPVEEPIGTGMSTSEYHSPDDLIIDRISKPLLTSEVSLCRPD